MIDPTTKQVPIVFISRILLIVIVSTVIRLG